MGEDMWLYALRVFLWGFSGVFLGLIILMYCIKIMSAVIVKLTVNTEKKA